MFWYDKAIHAMSDAVCLRQKSCVLEIVASALDKRASRPVLGLLCFLPFLLLTMWHNRFHVSDPLGTVSAFSSAYRYRASACLESEYEGWALQADVKLSHQSHLLCFKHKCINKTVIYADFEWVPIDGEGLSDCWSFGCRGYTTSWSWQVTTN